MEARGRFVDKIAGLRQKAFFRDFLTFFLLTLVAAALYGVTTLLFNSFQSHRKTLAREWAEKGRAALQASKPQDAIEAMRTSLSYLPEDRDNQLLLAEALANAERVDEARNYFLDLREANPTDGFVNLELARLERKRGNKKDALEYYRASVFGDWTRGGLPARRAARMELADYLIELNDMASARAELLISAGNASNQPNVQVMIGDRLMAADDPEDAASIYSRALLLEPTNRAAIAKAGMAYKAMGSYSKARELLAKALAMDSAHDGADVSAWRAALHDSERMEELSLSRELPSAQRANHILQAAKIARTRLERCVEPIDNSGQMTLPALDARWKKIDLLYRTLVASADLQDQVTQLIFDTERQTANVCGPARGDDALLLQLAKGQEAHGRDHQ